MDKFIGLDRSYFAVAIMAAVYLSHEDKGFAHLLRA